MMGILTGVLAFVAGLFVFGTTTEAVAGGKAPGRGKSDRAAARRAAEAVERALDWPGLADFLDAAAYTESRYVATAGRQRIGSNGALGLWQIKPTFAFPVKGAKKEWTREQAIAMGPRLMEPLVNAVAIGSYLLRLRGWNPDATLGNLRAGMAYPIFVKGRPTGLAPAVLRKKYPTAEAWAARYDQALRNFRTALEETDLDLDPGSPANFPTGPVPLVSALAAQVGVTL